MPATNFSEAARACRNQAQAFDGTERKLLYKVAEAFDSIVSREEIKKRIAATRCW